MSYSLVNRGPGSVFYVCYVTWLLSTGVCNNIFFAENCLLYSTDLKARNFCIYFTFWAGDDICKYIWCQHWSCSGLLPVGEILWCFLQKVGLVQWCLLSPCHRPISQIPQCTSPISHNTPVSSHNAPFRNRNVHTCAHFCYEMVDFGIFV